MLQEPRYLEPWANQEEQVVQGSRSLDAGLSPASCWNPGTWNQQQQDSGIILSAAVTVNHIKQENANKKRSDKKKLNQN